MDIPDSLDRKTGGEVTAGIMSSQGTFSVRTGKRSYLHLSARRSYLNLLYKRWLMADGNPIEYGFGDYNLTWYLKAGKRDEVWVDAYFGNDKAHIGAQRFSLDLEVSWGNLMGAVHWMHKGDAASIRQTAFFSGYKCFSSLSQDKLYLEIPSYIGSAGYKIKTDIGKLSFGADFTAYQIMPQAPAHKGFYSDMTEAEIQKGAEADIWADYSYSFNNGLGLRASLKAEGFISPEKQLFGGISPLVSMSWNTYGWGKFNLTYGIQHQYIFQSGLSNIGLPMDFWFMSGKYSRPQWDQSAALNYKIESEDGTYAFSTDLYYKKLYNQVEYHGSLFDLFTKEYHLGNQILTGSGDNFGVNFMIHKQAGDFTGWISYSLGRALRRFDDPDFPGVYPANHERIHDLNVVGSYKWRKWNFAGTFVFSSGRPFTAPESFYITSGNIISKNGEHNGCRMRPYIRLDLSVNRIIIKRDNMESSINFSLYNVLARENEVMWSLHINDSKFGFRPLAFYLKLLPSISYNHKF